ncbi:GNAT family N-acetyltransferase [Paeniglutamicibacter antarcticus]|uniref:GNAT family N-acetyltransferase n=1 Tax=Arthrobacter terrae TaxID=2935737 RepID=A0A931CM16_9MICC|nr:GNAT family N-acetyltransferase [Arthrobacter terrae]MBG0738650.1 GNAT family N-acetyltransferase [Arthrobacter terrae]
MPLIAHSPLLTTANRKPAALLEAPTVRHGSSGDLAGIADLFREQLDREPSLRLIEEALESFPSAVAVSEGYVTGFAYCGYMAPDLVELMNITVHAGCRSTGVGTAMLKLVEGLLVPEAKAVMLTNSTLYSDGKRPATNFYLRNGYALVASTGSTNMFWKDLT